MQSEVSTKYVVYELWSYFDDPPSEILCCPAWESSVSIKRIRPSKAVAKYYPDRFLHKHEAYVYRCESCFWWAVRESWLDYELNVDPDYLVVGESPCGQQCLPWLQVLEKEDLYERPMSLPESLGRWLSHGKRRGRLTDGGQ
jgi:hypothetical protein